MKKKHFAIFVMFALLAASCSIDEIAIEDYDEEPLSEDIESEYEEGIVIVKFTEEMASLIGADLNSGNVMTKSSELNNFAQTYGIKSITRVFSDDDRWLERQHREGLHLWYEIEYDPDAGVVTRAVSDLSDLPGVEIAEPSPKIKRCANYYNDTYYSNQWHLCGTYSINVEEVWEHFTKGSSDVIVAVVDGGIDPTHVDLVDNFIPGGAGGSRNFYSNSYNIVADYHGTHVGGIISAVSNNGRGVAGIAGGDYAAGIAGTKLLTCQIFEGDYSTGTSGLANAIQYGADNGALICQNSWGYSYTSESNASRGSTPSAVQTAIEYFNKYAGCDNSGNQLSTSLMKGGVVIFAAGNDGWQYAQPAQLETVIAVGATTNTGAAAYYTNYGDWVDICAPGSSIYSTYSGSAYASLSGTSMACPMVSGVAALVIAYQGGQGFTADQLKECLIEGADPDKVSAKNIGPYVDALGAVLYGMDQVPDDIESYDVSVLSNKITFTWNVPAGDEYAITPAFGTLLCLSNNKTELENYNPKFPSEDVTVLAVETEHEEIGAKISQDVIVDKFSTDYYVALIPYNYGSRYGNMSEIKTVRTGINNPPTITASEDIDDVQVHASRTVQIDFEIVDPDGHDVSIDYRPGSNAETWTKTSDTTYSLVLTGSAMSPDGSYVDLGSHISNIIATDYYGESSSVKVHYTILENQAPMIGTNLENELLILGNASTRTVALDLSEALIDPDEDELSYTFTNSSPTTVQAVLSVTNEAVGSEVIPKTKLTITGVVSGTSTISVTATDPRGLSCSQTIIVAVREEGETVIAYPNPVISTLYVGTEKEAASTNIRVTSSTGSLVYEGTENVSAFYPAKIDFSNFAPGSYSVNVKYGSTDVTKKVVKK